MKCDKIINFDIKSYNFEIKDYMDDDFVKYLMKQKRPGIVRSIKSKVGYNIKFIKFINKNIIGIAILLFEKNRAMLFFLHVDENNRKNKIGTSILKIISTLCYEKNIKEIYLKVLKNNIPAINLYKKNGYCFIENELFPIVF